MEKDGNIKIGDTPCIKCGGVSTRKKGGNADCDHKETNPISATEELYELHQPEG